MAEKDADWTIYDDQIVELFDGTTIAMQELNRHALRLGVVGESEQPSVRFQYGALHGCREEPLVRIAECRPLLSPPTPQQNHDGMRI